MRLIPCLASCAILLSSLAASATQPSDKATLAVKSAVEKELLVPMKQRDAKRSKFSRRAPMPDEQRVRVLEAAAVKDAKGKSFRTFAVDARWPFADDEQWTKDTIVGCVYPDTGAMFVRVGDDYRPAKILLGKKTKKAPATVCQPAPAANSKLAAATPSPSPSPSP